MSEPLDTFVFAPEIEAALVAAAFAAPWRIGEIMRELDPVIHFSRPDCRFVLEAIDLVYRGSGTTDFASILTALREAGQLEQCGGPQGVNSMFWEYRCGFSSPLAENEIFGHYIEVLQAYALARTSIPPARACYFTGGKGTLLPNKLKRSVFDPDWSGQTVVAGKYYKTGAWIGERADFINLKLAPNP